MLSEFAVVQFLSVLLHFFFVLFIPNQLEKKLQNMQITWRYASGGF